VPSHEPAGTTYRCAGKPEPGCPTGAQPDLEAQRVFNDAVLAACALTGGVDCTGGTQIPDEMDWDLGYEHFFREVHARQWCAGIHHAPNLHLGVEIGLWRPGRERVDYYQPLTSNRKWRTDAFMSEGDRVWSTRQWRSGKRASWQ
jgi:hypothetical protein